MTITRRRLLRVLLLLTVAGSYICLAYGKGDGPAVRIARNVAWNDFVFQIRFLLDDSSEDSFNKEVLTIHKFLKAHETEPRIGIYDLEVIRAIDRSRAHLQKADKDLESLRNELSYKEEQAALVR